MREIVNRENSKYTPKTFYNSKNTPNFLQIPNIYPFSKKSSKYTPKRVKQIPDFEFLNSNSDDADGDIPSTLPPNTRRPTGWPKNKRNRNSPERDEDQAKKLYRCGRCGGVGHNRKTCRNPI